MPRTLESWSLAQKEYMAVAFHDAFFFISIAIARENNLKIILPTAYLCYIGTHTVVSCQRFYSFIASSHTAQDQIVSGKTDGQGALEILSPVDQIACLQGLVKLHQAQLKHTFEWTDRYAKPLSPKCGQRFVCRRNLVNLRAKLSLIDNDNIVGLDTWETWIKDERFKECKNLCKNCLRVAKSRFEKGRETLWDLLPSCLGLPTWEELEKEAEIELL